MPTMTQQRLQSDLRQPQAFMVLSSIPSFYVVGKSCLVSGDLAASVGIPPRAPPHMSISAASPLCVCPVAVPLSP